jgi:putative oxidoreductase
MTNNLILLVARVLLAAIFILSGLNKFSDPAATAGMIANAGLPLANVLAYVAAITETLAGLAILAGFQTRYVSYFLALFCVFTGFVFHSGAINMPTFPAEANAMLSLFNQISLMKNITIAGGFLALSVAGAGGWSVDARRAA